MIGGALAALVQHALQQAGRAYERPANLEVLAIAIRKGLDSPQKVAFAHLNPSIRSRVAVHRAFDLRVAGRLPESDSDFQSILRTVETFLVFSEGPRA